MEGFYFFSFSPCTHHQINLLPFQRSLVSQDVVLLSQNLSDPTLTVCRALNCEEMIYLI